MGTPKLRVLVIDDDEVFGASASRLLEDAGFFSLFHRGPFGSLQALWKSSCDVVLLDISMPKLDGYLMSRMIRDTFGHRVRIVLCSNMEPAILERIAARVAADGCVPKRLFEDGCVDEIASILHDKPGTGRSAAEALPRGA